MLATECCEKGYVGVLQILEDCGLDLHLYKEKSDTDELSLYSTLHHTPVRWMLQSICSPLQEACYVWDVYP